MDIVISVSRSSASVTTAVTVHGEPGKSSTQYQNLGEARITLTIFTLPAAHAIVKRRSFRRGWFGLGTDAVERRIRERGSGR